jgi:hypothetical protein
MKIIVYINGGENVWKGVKVPHMGKLGQQKKLGMFGLRG